MKIERKENSGLVEFSSLKCGDVFETNGDVLIKIPYNGASDSDCLNITRNCLDNCGNIKVKHYHNAKLVLEENEYEIN